MRLALHQVFPLCMLLSTAVLAAVPQRAIAAQDSPNILVFIGDDIDWKDSGCYGNDAIRTPHIDALARQGLLFENAFLTTSSCSPTRISILTGKYPHQTGAEDLHMPLPDDQTFVSTYLRKNGYFAGHMLKTHYGPNGVRQFDWYSKNVKDFPKFVDEAGERPFFMWVGFRDAHRPYKPGAVSPPHDPADVKVPPYLADTEETRRDLALYYDEISRMDSHIGQMVEELRRRGRFENTLIVFLGDNGMPFPRAKGTLYDSGVGTPLVVCWPKIVEAGGVTAALTSVVDLAPTFLDVAGVDVPDDMAGSSLVPVLKDPGRRGREHVFSERNWHNADEHMRSVRTLRYKLIRNAYLDRPFGHPSDCSRCPSWHSLQGLKAKGKLAPEQRLIFRAPRPQFELYDLKNDRWEFHNLAGSADHADVFDELKSALDDWTDRTGDFPPTRRRRADNVNRVTGVKFTRKIGPQVESGEPEPLKPDRPKSK